MFVPMISAMPCRVQCSTRLYLLTSSPQPTCGQGLVSHFLRWRLSLLRSGKTTRLQISQGHSVLRGCPGLFESVFATSASNWFPCGAPTSARTERRAQR